MKKHQQQIGIYVKNMKIKEREFDVGGLDSYSVRL